MIDTHSPAIDVRIANLGTIWQFTLLSDVAREWQTEHLSDVPDYMLTANGFMADWRPARDIANGMHADGLTVTIDGRIPGLEF